jgi:hypothetical protein
MLYTFYIGRGNWRSMNATFNNISVLKVEDIVVLAVTINLTKVNRKLYNTKVYDVHLSAQGGLYLINQVHLVTRRTLSHKSSTPCHKEESIS